MKEISRKILLISLLFVITACQSTVAEIEEEPSTAEPISPTLAVEENIFKEEISDKPSYEVIEASPAPDKFSFVKIIGDGNNVALEEILRLEAQKALELGRAPFVDFYADWCPPCIAIEDNMDDPKMIDAFSGTYIIQLDFDEWKGKSVDAGFYVLGVPTYYEIDEDGRSTGRMLTGSAWGDDIVDNVASPMKVYFAGE